MFEPSEAVSARKLPSLAVEWGNISDDANMLLVLLSFFSTSEKISLDLPFRGATPRRRWNELGEIEGVDAVRAGLAGDVGSLLSDNPRLANAFRELNQSSAVSMNTDHTYTLDEAVARRVREGVALEHLSFWRRQALIITYRAIPWRYIEPA